MLPRLVPAPARPRRRSLLKASGAWALSPGAAAVVAGCAHTPVTTGGTHDVRALGARGDGVSDDTAVFQAALDACEKAGGTVLVPPGAYKLRPLRIGSTTTLRLEPGSVLLATEVLDEYPKTGTQTSHESSRVGLLYARDAHDIAIVGRGVIDARGMVFVDTKNLSYPGKDHDPKVTRQGDAFMQPPPGGFPHGPFARGNDRPGNPIHFRDCRNVTLEGFTLKNAPVWNCHMERCTDVLITGMRISSRDSDFRMPNDDGIDLTACKRVRILGCDIETGDDCIAIFGSEDVVVSTCTLRSRSAGVRVGYNGPDIRNCYFENLIIRESHRGLSVFVRSGGSIEDVSFSNISIETRHFTGRWWGKGEPIHVSALLWEPGVDKPGQIRNVRFSNISIRGEAGMIVYGTPGSIIRDVTFNDIRFLVRKGDLQASYGGNFDLRATRDKATAVFKHDIPALHCENVEGLRVRGFRLEWEDALPDYFTDGISVESFKDVIIQDFEGRQAHDRGAALSLRNGKHAWIRALHARPGTDTLLRHHGVEGALVIKDLDAREARTPVDPPLPPAK